MSEQGLRNLQRVYFTKIYERIHELGQRFLWHGQVPVEDWRMAETPARLTLRAARRLPYGPARPGQARREPHGSAWFRLRFRVPPAFRGATVALHFETGAEAIVFRGGEPVQGLNPGRHVYIVAERARGGEAVELEVEVAACATVPRQPSLAALNRDAWDAYWDLQALFELIDHKDQPIGWTGRTFGHALHEDDPRRARILFALNKAVDLIDYGNPAPEQVAAQARAVRRLLKPVYDCRANASAQTFACMGHAHIDVAWLWPLAETVRKCGRTFSNVLNLMERYPELLFVQSQPHLYEFTREHYPALFRRIRQRARQGRWIPTGGMWVEADCNVTGPESLVRQLLFGTRYFERVFGRTEDCLWLPDVFGYSAALPQLLKRSGIRYFLTQKISWCQFTSFPHHSFWWEGIDGTRLLTHFLPSEDYNSMLNAYQMVSAERRYRQKDRSPIQAVLYGFGDGGGGPTAEQLERLRRYRDLEGMPKLTPMAPREFFERLEKDSEELPLWVGELYLEYHRGTYTTQALNKRLNRKAELLLREAEMLSAFNLAAGARYDQRALNEAWRLVLLNQFHDIIPGSSIDAVYEDSHADYRRVFALAGRVREQALRALAAGVDTRGPGVPVLAFNALSWEREEVCAVQAPGLRRRGRYVAAAGEGDAGVPVQVGADGLARFRARLPAMGHAVYHIRPGAAPAAEEVRADARGLENERLRVEFDAAGRVRRVFDKRMQREALEPGAAGNEFILFEDKQVSCGAAWDVEIFYNDKPLERGGELVSADVIEQGPVRGVVRFVRTISRSVIRQDVVLAAGSARLDFVTTVEWGDEKDVLLKVAFPVNVRAERARYEIQFGSVERPTHWNRPQDFAMFEVPAQKWADLSEGDYGVALLNDCKYGHDTRGNVMRLTLLRAPKSPGATADVNRAHEFTYALLPHAGDFRQGVVREAYGLNVPPLAGAVRAAAGKGGAPAASRMAVSGENIVIETVKKAEDDGGIIVRLYEAHGCRGRRTFETALPVKRVEEVSLMEKPLRPLALRGRRLPLEFGPFEIKTLKLTLA